MTTYNVFVVISGGPGFRGSCTGLTKDELIRWVQGFPSGLKQTPAFDQLDNRTDMRLSMSISCSGAGGVVIEVEPISGRTKYDFVTSYEMTTPDIVNAIRGLSE